jgi:hypothetical protein
VKRPRRQDEDSKAILERRRFLIQSALAGLGAGALAASCEQQPKVCLSEVPLKVVPPSPKVSTQQPGQKAGPSTQAPASKPSTTTPPSRPVCLRPQPCLSERLWKDD